MKWLRFAALAALGVTLLLVAGGTWLLHSDRGRDLALARLLLALPGEVRIGQREGGIAGPLTLRDVVYQAPDGSQVRIARLRLDWQPQALWMRRMHLDSVEADGIEIEIAAATDDSPEPGFTLPQRLPWPTLRLPFALQLDAVRLRDLELRQTDDILLVIEQVELAGQWPRSQPLQLDRLRIRGPEGELQGQGRLPLDGVPGGQLQLQLWPADRRQPARLQMQENADGLRWSLQLDEQGEATLELQRDLAWRLDVDLQDFVAADWWSSLPDAAPFDLQLQAQGDRQQGGLRGQFRRGAFALRIEPSTLHLDANAEQLRLDPLQVSMADGTRVHARGSLQLPSLLTDVRGDIDGLPLPLGSGEPARYRGTFALDGAIDALRVTLDGVLQREALQADVEFAGRLGEAAINIEALSLQAKGSALHAVGRLEWSQQPSASLDLRLEAFDPALLAPSLSGRLQGRMHLEGGLTDQGPALQLDIMALHGTWLDRPLHVEGRIDLPAQGGGSSDLQARIGGSRILVRGSPGASQRRLVIDFEPLRLPDLLPDSTGEFRGQLQLLGSGDRARLQGELMGHRIGYGGRDAERLGLTLDLPLQPGQSGRIALDANGLRLSPLVLEQLQAEASGSLARFQYAVSASGPQLAVSARGRGGRDEAGWQGQVEQLRIANEPLPVFELQQPLQLRHGKQGLSLARNCLRVGSGQACLALQPVAGAQSLQLSLEALPLAVLQPWLPRVGDSPLEIQGDADGRVELQLASGQIRSGNLELLLPSGSLHHPRGDSAMPPLLQWQDLRVSGELTDGRLQVSSTGAIDEHGRLSLLLAGSSPLLDRDAALSGRIELDLPQIRLLALLPQTIVAPRGELQARLDLDGTWRAPRASGGVALRRGSAEIPALGLVLAELELALNGDAESWKVEASASSGGQPLRATGTLQQPFVDPVLDLDIHGEQVLMVDIPQAQARISPALQARWDGRVLRLRGSLQVPSATFDLERFEQVQTASADVRVLDPHPGDIGRKPLPIDADLRVVLGDKVELSGFGFDGGIAGSLQLRERPEAPTTARGVLHLRGDYTAYGQKLDIERGRLIYAGSAIDDPALDLRVARQVRGRRVGLDVSGSARDPNLSVWSEGSPTLDQGEALSLLLFGRPLHATQAADGEQLSQAALAVGGNLLVERLGSRLGFDSFELSESEALGGSAFSVGRFLSPRLHISYGIALFGSGQVLKLRYLLNEHLRLELQSGTETQMSVNYQTER